jgi:hypothetical protein
MREEQSLDQGLQFFQQIYHYVRIRVASPALHNSVVSSLLAM